MINIILTIILAISLCTLGYSQHELKNYLINYEQTPKAASKGLNFFRNGNYKAAYQQLKKANKTSIFNYKEFLQQALLYQRNPKLVKQAIARDAVDLEPFELFFAQQAPMSITLDQTTSVDLNKNVLTGIVGTDTIRILFDTGGDGISINEKYVEKYQMVKDTSISKTGHVPALGIQSTSHPVIIPSLKIGNMLMHNVPAKYRKASSQPTKQWNKGPEVDMVMGLDIFIGFIAYVEFNWKQKKLTFSTSSPILKHPNHFIPFDAKPICLFGAQKKTFTALLDTGSPVDLIPQNIYLNHYTQKETKTYGNFSYNNYTVLAQLGNTPFSLVVADYLADFKLTLNGQQIDFIIGNNKQVLKLDLEHNLFEIY